MRNLLIFFLLTSLSVLGQSGISPAAYDTVDPFIGTAAFPAP